MDFTPHKESRYSVKITCHKGVKRKMLQAFESAQWPLADEEHYGKDAPDFRKDKFTIVAKQDDAIVGFIFMMIDTGVATVDSLLVHHKSRREGVGTMLLKKAEEKAKELGCHVIRLETGHDWHAKKFYEKHGYTFQALLKEYYGKRDFILMDKRI